MPIPFPCHRIYTENILLSARVPAGSPLVYIQTSATLRKKYIQTSRNLALSFFKLFIPIIMFLCLFPETDNLPPLKLKYPTNVRTKFFVHYAAESNGSGSIAQQFKQMFPTNGNDELELLQRTETNPADKIKARKRSTRMCLEYILNEYDKNRMRTNIELIGGYDASNIDGQNAACIVWHNNLGYHSLGIQMARFFSMGVGMMLSGYEYVVTNWPLPYTSRDREYMMYNPLLTLIFGTSMAFVSALYMVPYILVSKSKSTERDLLKNSAKEQKTFLVYFHQI